MWMLLAALPLASCNDDDAPGRPDDLGELTAPVLSVSAEEVTLDAEQADEEALAFSWTPAGGAEASAVSYDLYLNAADADLFEGVKREVGAAASLAFTHAELNELLVGRFGAKSGERLALHACVYARTADDRIGGKASNEVAFAATAYEAVVGEPESLWMMGGACAFGWDQAIELPRETDGSYVATEVELKFGKAVDNKGFKFYGDASGSYPFYGQKIDGAFGEVQVFASANDGDSQFYPLQHGYTSGIYTVRVDLAALQLTLTRTGDVEEFDPDAVLYILGDDMEYGWDMVEQNALYPVEENVYEGTGIRLKPTSQFKFDFHDWTEYVRDESAEAYWTAKKKGEGDGDVRFVPGDQGLEEGYYTVRVDLNTLKVTLTAEAPSDYPRALYLFGPATEAGWDLDSFIPMTQLREGVFRATGVRIDVGEANDDDNKGNGFKFGISNREWSTEYGAKESFEGESGYRGWELGENENQFYPLLMGCTSGTYTITADLTTLTVAFEAE